MQHRILCIGKLFSMYFFFFFSKLYINIFNFPFQSCQITLLIRWKICVTVIWTHLIDTLRDTCSKIVRVKMCRSFILLLTDELRNWMSASYVCIYVAERPNRILRHGKIMERTIPELDVSAQLQSIVRMTVQAWLADS